jgi:predicted RNA-binding protein with TRAM domain
LSLNERRQRSILVEQHDLARLGKKWTWTTVLKVAGQESKNNHELDVKSELSTFHGLKEGDEAELEITQKSRDGRGLARLNGLLIFVSGASPGEKVKVRIVKLGVRHAEAEVIKSQRMATASAIA